MEQGSVVTSILFRLPQFCFYTSNKCGVGEDRGREPGRTGGGKRERRRREAGFRGKWEKKRNLKGFQVKNPLVKDHDTSRGENGGRERYGKRERKIREAGSSYPCPPPTV